MDATQAPTTLANIAEGKLEEQFQAALDRVSEVLQNAEAFERNKDGELRVRITCEIDFTRKGDAAMVAVDTRALVKTPKPLRVGRYVYFTAGAFVTPLLVQQDMFPARAPLAPVLGFPTREE